MIPAKPSSFSGSGRSFCKEHVYIFGASSAQGASEDVWFPGYLAIFTELGVTRICWTSYERLKQLRPADPYKGSDAIPAPPESTEECVIKIVLRAVHAVWRHTPETLGQGVPVVKLTLEGGQDLPPFLFYHGGVREFFTELRALTALHESPEDPDLFFVNDQSRDALTRSFHVIEPEEHVAEEEAALEVPVEIAPSASGGVFSLLSTLASTARVGANLISFVAGGSRPQEAGPPSASSGEARPEFKSSIGSFEVMENYAPERRLSMDPESVPLPTRSRGLDEVAFIGAFDDEGRISVENRDRIRRLVFSGGCHPTIRGEVWKYLLGVYRWDSTHAEREALLKARAHEYEGYKMQHRTITEEQASHFRKYRARKHIIERDVLRTDRTERYFEAVDPTADNNAYVPGAHRTLDMLHDILLTYSFFNFDTGYCQGMNDYLAPLLEQVDSEVDAFWLFKAVMDRVASVFAKDQSGMHTQLRRMSALVKLMDPEFHAYLEEAECANFHFCFRWLLLTFKREMRDYEAIKSVWEACWSAPTPHFQLFIAMAMLQTVRDSAMQKSLEFDGLLLMCNGIGGQKAIDYPSVLVSAARLFQIFDAYPDDVKERALL